MMRVANGCLAILLMSALWARADFEAGLFAYSMGNYEGAAREFEACAQRGETQGEYYFGLLHEEGQGLDMNYVLARQWYLKAAGKGDIDAAFALGRIHAQGLGVERDLPVAYLWYGRAARGGHYLGKQEQDKCISQMTPQQLHQARSLAGE